MRILRTKRKLIVFLVFLFIFAIRISIAFISYKNNIMVRFSDDNAYMQYAESILEQGPLVSDIEKLSPTAKVVGPGLPWIMALILKISSGGWLAIFIFNAFIGSLTCFIIYLLGRKIFSERAGLYAAIWSAFYILFLKYIPTAGKEIWLTFLITSILLLMVEMQIGNSFIKYPYVNVIILSFIFSLLVHIDERYIAYSLLLSFFIVLFEKKGWRTGLVKVLLFAFITILLMTPWLIRNFYVYNKLVVISVRTAPMTDKILGVRSKESLLSPEGRWYLNDAQIKNAANGKAVRRNDGKQINGKQLNAMKDGILPHKFSKLESMWSVFQILWKPVDLNRGYSTTGYRYDGVWSLRHNLTVGLTYGLLIPFLIWGFILLIRQQRKIGIFLISVLVYHSLIHMLFIPFTRNRYHIPVDAIIIVIGIYGMINIIDRFKLSYFNKKRS